ncbi:hypothetical protein B0H16DRAFT_1533295 [Mycena metata]|uniref:Uncharacterized protein n=1 Tax=Mycena metata TaxID=1033252 RepID=A0AAD7JAX9_9AGAR|nr:hypothetical protein B0H16DRAFT_1533295 [Mycena metata]
MTAFLFPASIPRTPNPPHNDTMHSSNKSWVHDGGSAENRGYAGPPPSKPFSADTPSTSFLAGWIGAPGSSPTAALSTSTKGNGSSHNFEPASPVPFGGSSGDSLYVSVSATPTAAVLPLHSNSSVQMLNPDARQLARCCQVHWLAAAASH